MTREEFKKSIEETFNKGLSIVARKNNDYAKGDDPFRNFKFANLVGLSVEKAILVRISDKLARISNVLDKKSISVVDESLDDTIIDAINYLAILKAWVEENQHSGLKITHEAQESPKTEAVRKNGKNNQITDLASLID